MDKMDGLSLNLEKENVDKLKELFPAAVEEGKIDFDMLRALLGDEVDDSREKYQFTWNGKSKAIKLAQTPSTATLRPCKEKSKNWDTTENLYIEGDNLEVLKQLQKTYYGKIKTIFIDPPYNTGKDFVYKDSFSNSLDNYKSQTNQSTSSNPETNGRFHTDWLNMMYPRLLLAKNLLKNDGAIFITLDDTEIASLRKMCDEVFGESNFIGWIIWQHSIQPKGYTSTLSIHHNHMLCYSKSSDFELGSLNRTEEDNKAYSNPDNDPNGPWRAGDVRNALYRPNLIYDIITPSGKVIKPCDNGWRWSKETLNEKIKSGEIIFSSDETRIIRKIYLKNLEGRVPESIWFGKDVGTTRDAISELKKLFKTAPFDTPKPTALLKRIFKIMNSADDIMLDFFSGSSSSADAIMQWNYENKTNSHFIMVQLPEKCDEKSEAYKSGYNNICEIGEERIRRAGEQIKADWEKEHPSDTLFSSEEEFTTDIGFKVFKLDSSNVNEWDSSLELDEKELAERLGEVFKTDRSKEDILYEIMLKYGVFDRQVEDIEINGKTMYRVGKRYMIVCLEDNIDSSDIKAIGELSPKTVIFKESGFIDDNAKLNAVYNLEKAGVEDIKCI